MLPWMLLVVGSAASLAANLAVAQPTAGRVIAAWPSFALMRHTYACGNAVRSSANELRAGTGHQTLRFAPYVRMSRYRRVEPQKQRDVAKIGRNRVDMPPGNYELQPIRSGSLAGEKWKVLCQTSILCRLGLGVIGYNLRTCLP